VVPSKAGIFVKATIISREIDLIRPIPISVIVGNADSLIVNMLIIPWKARSRNFGKKEKEAANEY